MKKSNHVHIISRLPLKALILGTSTVCWSKSFQLPAVLCEKDYFLLYLTICLFLSDFNAWPLVSLIPKISDKICRNFDENYGLQTAQTGVQLLYRKFLRHCLWVCGRTPDSSAYIPAHRRRIEMLKFRTILLRRGCSPGAAHRCSESGLGSADI